MIGHLVRRVRAEKAAQLARIDEFCEEQERRVRSLLAQFEARRIERDEDPFLRERDRLSMDMEVRK